MDSMNTMATLNFYPPDKSSGYRLVKKIVFIVLTEYRLKPNEGGKDRDLNDFQFH